MAFLSRVEYVSCSECSINIYRLSGDWYTPPELNRILCGPCFKQFREKIDAEKKSVEVTDFSYESI